MGFGGAFAGPATVLERRHRLRRLRARIAQHRRLRRHRLR
jgi:hypothetical protein